MISEDFNLAPRHKNFNPRILSIANSQNPEMVFNKATKEAKILYSWDRQVAMNYDKIRSFARLSISKHGILYGRIDPEHKVEDLVLDFFTERFPIFVVVLESKRGTFIGKYEEEIKILKRPLMGVIKKLETRLPVLDILEDLNDFDESIWQGVYDTNYISQRKNKKHFLRGIPKKYHKLDSLSYERKVLSGSKSLTDFM